MNLIFTRLQLLLPFILVPTNMFHKIKQFKDIRYRMSQNQQCPVGILNTR